MLMNLMNAYKFRCFTYNGVARTFYSTFVINLCRSIMITSTILCVVDSVKLRACVCVFIAYADHRAHYPPYINWLPEPIDINNVNITIQVAT